jgi:hypothetical protein
MVRVSQAATRLKTSERAMPVRMKATRSKGEKQRGWRPRTDASRGTAVSI